MPSVDRRTLLTAGPVAAAVGALASTGRRGVTSGDLGDWDAVRAEFDLDPDVAHFAAFVLAGHPAPVRDAIDRWRERLDTDTEEALSRGFAEEVRARRLAAASLGVEADDIALTDSTTMGLGLVYHGLPLEEGDHVLTTAHDFYATHEALRLAAARSGATVDRVSLYDDPASASVDEMVSRLADGLQPNTRVVAVTWVHSSTGVKIPVREIADALADHKGDVLLCLDAVHGFGAEDAGPPELGCDVFISGTHKWLFGPRGTGLVWAHPDVGDSIAPIVPSFDIRSFENWRNDTDTPVAFGQRATPGGYHSFEHRWALPEAFEFHAAIGRDRVAERTHELATRLKEGLAELSGVELITPIDQEVSAGIVCCDLTGLRPFEAMTKLRRDHAISASVTPYREPYLRFGTSIVTSPDEVDATVEAVAEIT